MIEPFPDNFLWGAALTGHRIEGGNFASDWWRWEQRPGHITDRSTSKTTADHWNRYVQDLDLARDFGLNTLLINLEWSRIEPEPGKFDEAALSHYVEVIQGMRDRNIEPICILQQVTLPEWFARKRGWNRKDAVKKFGLYAETVAAKLSDQVKWWIPVAEPMHWITRTYFDKRWPSAYGGLSQTQTAIQNMARAHAAAYHILHNHRDDAMVGPSIRLRNLTPHNPYSAWDARTALRESRRCNHMYLDALVHGQWPVSIATDKTVKDTTDFIGASYYGQERMRFRLTRPKAIFTETVDADGKRASETAIEADSASLASLLNGLQNYNKPILITGNGLAEGSDAAQCGDLLDHTSVIRHALDRAIPIKGYIYRSLLDGMEWTEGLKHHRALMHVDFEKLTRTPNTIAYLYKELCETGAVRPGTVAQFCPQWTSPVLKDPS